MLFQSRSPRAVVELDLDTGALRKAVAAALREPDAFARWLERKLHSGGFLPWEHLPIYSSYDTHPFAAYLQEATGHRRISTIHGGFVRAYIYGLDGVDVPMPPWALEFDEKIRRHCTGQWRLNTAVALRVIREIVRHHHRKRNAATQLRPAASSRRTARTPRKPGTGSENDIARRVAARHGVPGLVRLGVAAIQQLGRLAAGAARK